MTEAEILLRQAVAEVHAAPFPLSGWQVAEPEITLGDALARSAKLAEAGRLLQDFETRVKGYPEAALLRHILARAEQAKKRFPRNMGAS